jgi:PQQ-dependent catabolism-associated CXXCW motif protein
MRQDRRALLFAAAVLPFLGDAARAASSPPEPSGYRMDKYHAPTPQSLRGATVLTTAEAAKLWHAGHAAFIDVLPQPPRPGGLAPGTIWHPAPRRNIPGSIWLPDTGYGALAPPTLAYLERGLQQATGGDKNRIVVFYCKPDCWMSWNAAKRALSLGYSHVDWYPGGAADWHKAGLPLAPSTPLPRRR